jgi:hypothetical protein
MPLHDHADGVSRTRGRRKEAMRTAVRMLMMMTMTMMMVVVM